MQEWAKDFYLSEAWKKCRASFMASKHYVCERCGGTGAVAHHKTWLNPKNIGRPEITLSWDNLECLCYECHAIEHMAKRTKVYFDEAGEIERVKESPELRNFKKAQADIDRLLKSIKNNPYPPGMN